MLTIRPACADDAPALAEIYADAVLHGFGTFEETPPPAAEMEQRRAKVAAFGLPYLIAEVRGAAAGFAYASPFRPRAAYRYTVEDSVYIHPDHKGCGVGKGLLQQVIADCESLGLRRMLAVIGDSANAGSVGLHRTLGFEPEGVLPAVGWKHGRWLDVVTMSRALNAGDTEAPTAPGLLLEEPR